jgi:predicted RNase H-like nuclease (RuvC/YqgF family)
MTKRIISLYLDSESIALLKARGINISERVRSLLDVELGFTENKEETTEELFAKAKIKMAKMSEQIKDLTTQKEKYSRELKVLKTEMEKVDKKKGLTFIKGRQE